MILRNTEYYTKCKIQPFMLHYEYKEQMQRNNEIRNLHYAWEHAGRDQRGKNALLAYQSRHQINNGNKVHTSWGKNTTDMPVMLRAKSEILNEPACVWVHLYSMYSVLCSSEFNKNAVRVMGWGRVCCKERRGLDCCNMKNRVKYGLRVMNRSIS